MIEKFLVAVVIASTPLLFATIGEIITEKAGHLNLGVEGMMLIGAISGFASGIITQNPILALLGAILGGMVSSYIYAFLTVTLRANQIVSGLALTIFGQGISSYLGTNFVGEKMPKNIIEFYKPIKIPFLSKIPVIGNVLFNQDIFVYLSFVLAIVISIYLYKTKYGLNLIAIGENPKSADNAGVNINLYKYVHILLGGALCGLGGAYLSIVEVPVWQENITSGKGWIAIALVIFAKWNPLKAIYASFIFGGLSILGLRIQHLNVPQSLLEALPYLFTIVILVISSIKKDNENGPPKGLSIPYFREER
ncbi:MAG: ABC transporter permease [Bacillota bacterium]